MAERKKICPRCKGTGISHTFSDGKTGASCIDCNGKGYVFNKSLKTSFKRKIALEGIETVFLWIYIPKGKDDYIHIGFHECQDYMKEYDSVPLGKIDYQNFLKDNFDVEKIVLTDEIKSRICPAYFESQFSGHKPVEGVLCSRNKKLSIDTCPLKPYQRRNCLGISYCWNAYDEANPVKLSLALTPLEYEVLCQAIYAYDIAFSEKRYAYATLRERFKLPSVDAYDAFPPGTLPTFDKNDPAYLERKEKLAQYGVNRAFALFENLIR